MDIALDPANPLAGVAAAAARLPPRFAAQIAVGHHVKTIRGGDAAGVAAWRRAFARLDNAALERCPVRVSFIKLPWPQ